MSVPGYVIEPTNSLGHERQYISDNEYLGQPGHPDKRKVSGVKHPNNPCQNHVDGRGEEGRCQQNQERLCDIGAPYPFVLFLVCLDATCNIADRLDCFITVG